MSGDGKDPQQPGLWDVPSPVGGVEGRPRRRPAGSTGAPVDTTRSAEPAAPPTPASPPATSIAPLDMRELWGVDEVSAYLGVPRQTLYAWRHTGKGPKGFRVGKHLRWHPRTVVEWTFELERQQ